MRKTKSIWVFFSLWFLTLLLYYRTIGAGFTMDFVGWQESYDTGSFRDILNCFGYNGLHQVLHLIFYSFYRIFRTDGLPWYLLFTFLHALNSGLVFHLFRFLFRQLHIKNGGMMALVTALFFLVSPYHVEPVVWKVCVHYLMSLTFLLIVLWNVSQYLVQADTKRLVFAHLTFILALFTLELSLIFPVLVLIYVLFGYFTFAQSTSIKKNLTRLVFPQFLLLFGYVFLNKLILGDWVGHYGTNTHLQVDITKILGTMYKYFAKYSLFGRFFDFNKTTLIFGIFDQEAVVWGITIALIITTIIIFGRWSVLSNKLKVVWLFVGSFFVGLLPVSNLFFYFLMYGENDRYGYMVTPFIMAILVILLFQFRYTFRYLIIIGWISLSIVFQQKVTDAWHENAIIYESLLKDFRWYDSPRILVLNIPDNYRGTFLYRTFHREAPLVDDLKYHLQKPFNGHLQYVAQYNMMNLNEGVHIQQIDSNHLKVVFNQWGTWWWESGIGATDYENDLYKFEHVNKGYLLTFKQQPNDYTLIYQDGHQWKEFKFQ